MSQNPLQKYFRQPKISISLPSQGTYTKIGTIEGDVNNLTVFGMTGMDEILVKTPDALFSGESTVKVVESCCPAVKDAWELTIIDTDLIFAAIRIATYGTQMEISHTCSHCGASHEYDIDLTRIIDHYSTCKFSGRVVFENLVIKLQPLTYRQSTDFNIKNFSLQKKIIQSDEIVNAEEKQVMVNELWKELASNQTALYIASIESVETETVNVTERGYIAEWLENCDKSVIDAIKTNLAEHRAAWAMPTFPVKCDRCQTTANLSLDLDQSNFFV